MAHEATIRNLDQEQSRLKEKINRLEEERGALLNQSQAANEQHKQHVLKLEQVRPARHPSRCSLRGGGGGIKTNVDVVPTAFSPPQSLREEHQGYEKELSRLRAHYEEEMLRFKEAQVRALEEMEEKHQAMSEEAQQEKEEEKKLLVTVCTHFRNALNDAAADSLTVFQSFQTHHRAFIDA